MAPAGNPACHPAGSFISAVASDLHADRGDVLPCPPSLSSPASTPAQAEWSWSRMWCLLERLSASPGGSPESPVKWPKLTFRGQQDTSLCGLGGGGESPREVTLCPVLWDMPRHLGQRGTVGGAGPQYGLHPLPALPAALQAQPGPICQGPWLKASAPEKQC